MRIGFYRTLALNGIKKNKKTYLPYILTCIGMVMMYYIICFLSTSSAVTAQRGGEDMQMVLGFGCGVIAVFAVIFLFCTNSFLIRRRKKEFGLYNILGMGKRHLFLVLFWETLQIGAISLIAGLVCGILFSKLAELVMFKMLEAEGSFAFTIEWGAVVQTLLLFAFIFFLILLNGIRQIQLSKPIELLHSETMGEKPPRARWILAVLGAALLIGAYYLAVSIEDPMSAMVWFFVAVIMVIIATYLLFIAGSVALCRLLQKNKKYYYKTEHFVSVSSMGYRMKRNGAGLATICILSTMVLVMISSTACLFIGRESMLRNRYPRNIELDTYSLEETYTESVQEIVKEVVGSHGLLQENVLQYQHLDVGGYQVEDQIIFDQGKLEEFSMSDYTNVKQLFIIPISDYNRLMGTTESLAPDQVLLYCTKGDKYPYDTITIEGCDTMQVKGVAPDFLKSGVDTSQVISSLYIFVSDDSVMEEIYQAQARVYGDRQSFRKDYYGFDLSCDGAEAQQIYQEIGEKIRDLQLADSQFPQVDQESVARERETFYSLYGGMFFLGVLLGIVFLLAAVLIIYYKQVSEGYEDQSRFQIMQKVGMTKKEIRKSINSQILTVFFLPLLAAGVHVAFAFPMIQKMLLLFGLTDVKLFVLVMVGSYLLFALFYVMVYRITSRAYYSIVSAKE